MLAENIASVKAQTCHSIEQVFIPDRNRRSIQVADRALGKNVHRVDGEYVYILDDDCMLVDDGFVEAVRGVVREERPGIVMVKARRPPGPPSRQALVPTIWKAKLRHGSTNCLCYVIEANIWKRHIAAFGKKPWGGDWWFLDEVLQEEEPKMYWLDMIVADARQLGRGRIFEHCAPGWFERVVKREGLEKLGRDDWRLRLWTQD